VLAWSSLFTRRGRKAPTLAAERELKDRHRDTEAPLDSPASPPGVPTESRSRGDRVRSFCSRPPRPRAARHFPPLHAPLLRARRAVRAWRAAAGRPASWPRTVSDVIQSIWVGRLGATTRICSAASSRNCTPEGRSAGLTAAAPLAINSLRTAIHAPGGGLAWGWTSGGPGKRMMLRCGFR